MGPSRKREGPAGSPRDQGLRRSYYQQPALPAALGCVCVCVPPDASEEAEGRGSGKEGNKRQDRVFVFPLPLLYI